MIGQITRLLRIAARLQIRRRCTENPAAVADLAHLQVGIRKRSQTNGGIHSLAHHIEKMVGKAQPDFDLRIITL